MPKGLGRLNDAAGMLRSTTRTTWHSKPTQGKLAKIFRDARNFVAAALGRVRRTIRKIRTAPEVVKATRLWLFQSYSPDISFTNLCREKIS